ncbi:MAG: SufD family Fe-S cluster assembly protein [Thermotogae bacterium]|nr:SufD family Fe-S cluster assembly protein [Thermotogota bacterium]
MLETRYDKEFEALAKYYEKSGGDVSKLLDKRVVSIIVSGNQIIGRNTVPGVKIESEEIENGVKIYLEIEDNVSIENPIHLCTGYLKPEGVQVVIIDTKIGKNSKAEFLSHCVFPRGKKFTHRMISNIEIGENSSLSYEDVHFHSEDGGVTVEAIYNARLSKNAKYDNTFHLTKTRVGKLKVNMNVDLGEYASAYIESKVYEKKDDVVEIIETLNLNGQHSSGIAKTVVFSTDESSAKIINKAYGNAPYSKGHIECNEIVKGENVRVGTIPELYVKDEKAELTHEASIGRINSKQLETLMAKGLGEEEATELIIRGMLK